MQDLFWSQKRQISGREGNLKTPMLIQTVIYSADAYLIRRRTGCYYT